MTRELLKEMPKGEFHLHLEGSLPYSFLRELDPVKFAELPPFWNRDYRFATFPDFDRELLAMTGLWFTSPERYHKAAKAVFDDAREQGVLYLETSIASGCLEFGGLDIFEVCAAVKSAVPEGMTVKLFMGIHHSGYNENYGKALEESLTCPNLDGYDIHGNEPDYLGDWAADFYMRAREAGKFTKCHAGEFMGPEFIERAVSELGVTRIEHGVRAVESGETMKFLADGKVVLDVCPVSNIKLKVVSSFKEHPLKKLMAAGIICTVNRDDPLIFGSTLEEEYHLVQEEMGLTDKEIIDLVRNGFRIALVSEEQRRAYLKELDLFLEKNSLN
ncbi:MAG: adenosine deaminase family protein [Spirochaetales bacterium]|nr:adenosine deaminase family protein [Spirochaetales bacterium]